MAGEEDQEGSGGALLSIRRADMELVEQLKPLSLEQRLYSFGQELRAMQLENGLAFELEPLERVLARMQSTASEVRRAALIESAD